MTHTVRLGLLGAGFIGQMHSLAFSTAGLARKESSLRAELVALADTDRDLLTEIRQRYQWADTTTDWRELLDLDLDLFVNAGPNDVHANATLAAAKAGIPVFCEKPLATTADEAYELWKAVDRLDVEHRCAFMHRFIPAIRLARDLVRSGDLGTVRHFRSTFLLDMVDPHSEPSWRFDRERAGAGALGDLGSHHIDVARFIIGEELTQVSALTRTWTPPSQNIQDINDDTFAALALLNNGATAVFEASRVATAHNLTGRIEIDGTNRSLSWSMERLNELTIREPGQGPRTLAVTRPGHPYEGFWLPGGIQGSHPLGWNECFTHQAHDILSLAAGTSNESLAATFEDGYRVAETIAAIDLASTTGATVRIDYRS